MKKDSDQENPNHDSRKVHNTLVGQHLGKPKVPLALAASDGSATPHGAPSGRTTLFGNPFKLCVPVQTFPWGSAGLTLNAQPHNSYVLRTSCVLTIPT